MPISLILAVYCTSISFQSVEATGAAPFSLPYTVFTMASGRQLKLTNRANFFTDPAFADLVNNDDADLRKRLDLFKSRALSLGGQKDSEPHNLQVGILTATE